MSEFKTKVFIALLAAGIAYILVKFVMYFFRRMDLYSYIGIGAVVFIVSFLALYFMTNGGANLPSEIVTLMDVGIAIGVSFFLVNFYKQFRPGTDLLTLIGAGVVVFIVTFIAMRLMATSGG